LNEVNEAMLQPKYEKFYFSMKAKPAAAAESNLFFFLNGVKEEKRAARCKQRSCE